MDSIKADKYTLSNLGKINIILGKNGCGKSTLLRSVEKTLSSNPNGRRVKYITPERGGNLIYDPGIYYTISNTPTYLSDSRRINRIENFRQQSIAQFRKLEILFLRELEATQSLRINSDYNFDTYFNKLNNLLDNIEIKRDQSSFKIFKKGTEQEISPHIISSGESELISLGIECLVFEKECLPGKDNLLLLDEPDVHLHPDLQARLSYFLCEIAKNKDANIILATHSTAILGALEDYEDTHVAFMSSNQFELCFEKISDEYRKILPVFGAHPLSNLFNKTPILLLEGEDDVRIWQQAIRTSNQKLKIYPCSTDGITNMSRYEQDVEKIIRCVYDNAKAFSLRDRDEGAEIINNLRIIKRFKLSCRASENLLLTEEVLNSLEITWEELKEKITAWLAKNEKHPHYEVMCRFQNDSYDRKNSNLKEIRNDLMSLIGKNIPWEIAVGQAIGKMVNDGLFVSEGEHTLFEYLGKNLIKNISS